MAEANSYATYSGASYPAEGFVLNTAPTYGDAINVLNGTYDPGAPGGDVPPVEDVRFGIVYDAGTKVGVLELPVESQVLIGIGFGAYGTEFEGSLVDIPGGMVTPMPPVLSSGAIRNPLLIGDSYEGDRKFLWNIPAWSGVDPATLTAKFIGTEAHCTDCDGAEVWSVTGAAAVSATAGTWDITFEMNSAASAVIPPGEYNWMVQLITAGGEVTTVVSVYDHDDAIWACIQPAPTT